MAQPGESAVTLPGINGTHASLNPTARRETGETVQAPPTSLFNRLSGFFTGDWMTRRQAGNPMGNDGNDGGGGQRLHQNRNAVQLYFGPHFLPRRISRRVAARDPDRQILEGWMTTNTLSVPALEQLLETGLRPPAEMFTTKTIRSSVNLKKSTLKLFRRHPEEAPNHYSLKFGIDSTVPCKVTILLMAQEDESDIPTGHTPFKLHYDKSFPDKLGVTMQGFTFPQGLGQGFRLPKEFHIDTNQYTEDKWTTMYNVPKQAKDDETTVPPVTIATAPMNDAATAENTPSASSPIANDLDKVVVEPAPRPVVSAGPNSATYPIVIVIEGLSDGIGNSSKNKKGVAPKEPGSSNAQATYAHLLRNSEGSFDIKIVKQKILADGVPFLLQEIYGVGESLQAQMTSSIQSIRSQKSSASLKSTSSSQAPAATTANAEVQDDAFGSRECVICMSDDRDTTVLPCRHLCLCRECADALREQSNRCPICRQPFHSLLHIRIASCEPVKKERTEESGKATIVKSSSVMLNESDNQRGQDVSLNIG